MLLLILINAVVASAATVAPLDAVPPANCSGTKGVCLHNVSGANAGTRDCIHVCTHIAPCTQGRRE